MSKSEKYFTFMVLYLLVAGQSINADSKVAFVGSVACLVVALVYFILYTKSFFSKE